MLGKGYEATYN